MLSVILRPWGTENSAGTVSVHARLVGQLGLSSKGYALG